MCLSSDFSDVGVTLMCISECNSFFFFFGYENIQKKILFVASSVGRVSHLKLFLRE